MHSCPSRRPLSLHGLKARLLILILLSALLLSLIGFQVPILAQQEEPSPIEVELIAPEQAGPGTEIEVLVKYDAVDPNASADLNYNVFGPSHVLTREPEPPNPAYNTWVPTKETAQGTIKIRLQVHGGSEGQTIRHLVEVRWGIKAVQFQAQTLVKPIPPTPAARPRPRPPAPTAVPTPTPTVDSETAAIEIAVRDVSLVDLNGQPISTAQVDQELALEATYVSARDAQQVTVEIQFEPDVIRLDLPKGDRGYIQVFPTLPAAPEGAPLFVPVLKGRIGTHGSGGGSYSLQATVRIVPTEGDDAARGAVSAPIEISQAFSIRLSLRTEVESIRAGETFILHALVENPGGVSVNQIQLSLLGLPAGFAVNPGTQTIDEVAASGGSESRVFTLRSPENYEGQVSTRLVATIGETVLESVPLSVMVSAPRPLRLEMSASETAIYAGDTVYVNSSAMNDSKFDAFGVTAKLIDISGNLGVLVQDVGDIPAGEFREWVFVVRVPDDFPIDTEASLVLQTISEDGITSQSSETKIAVACRPRLETLVEPPSGRVQGGDSVEAIALVKNAGSCTARDVSVSLVGLPDSFAQPPAQRIIELRPDQVRYVTFTILVPQGYRGEAPLIAKASTEQGVEGQSPPITMTIRGLSPAIAIVSGLLILVVAITGVVGVVLYFRNR